ncbi:MAG TPA: nucleotidyltransferase family protein [Rhizomicrobium sp.]|nr:nucleotidyltransferase family protein [Rhizomicrobium sp.]
MQITAVVLAGGRGTRIADLYPDIPKPMVPVCGRPFLFWVTRWLVEQGISDIVYSVGYRAEQIEQWMDSVQDSFEATLRCVREAEPLGTGGGVLQCLELCAGHVLVVNGDSLTPVALAPLIAKAAAGDGALLGVRMEDAARYGTLSLSSTGRLLKFAEKRPGAGIINAGIYLLSRSLLEPFPRGRKLSMEEELLPALIDQGANLGCEVAESAPFLDIGTPESVKQAETFVRSHIGS